jgi:ABC-type branched-subunit amino acid transport system ATPase component
MNGEPILTVDAVHAGYLPGIDILRGLSVEARANSVTLVIGPNGAGKSTLLRTIFGLLRPNRGTIAFRSKPAAGLRSSEIKAAGISYVTQEINSFPGLTVEENLRMGAWVFRRDARRVNQQLDWVYGIFPALVARRRTRADQLSGGQGRMLSVARELMTNPSLLLVDEPTAGLAPNLVDQIYAILTRAKEATEAAILLVEQNVEQALPYADYLYLIDLGRVKAEGAGRDFTNARVRALIQECLLG